MSGSAKHTFNKGDILMRQGDAGDGAYVIEDGSVEILLEREGQLIQVGTRGPGSLIGEMAMVDDRPRTATVRALGPCTVMRVSRGDFARRVDAADPVLKMAIHVIMARYRDLAARTQSLHLPLQDGGAAIEEHENRNEVHDMALSAIKIHNELKGALAKNELELRYQPIIDIQRMKIAGFEALMRWNHPEKGLISPGIFIPVAEESGLVTDMTSWALDTACGAVKALHGAARAGLLAQEPLFASVNFSVRDFSGGQVFERVRDTLARHGVAPEMIHMEVTESLLMEAPENAKAALEKCRALGVGVSIDDFGSGYSSLSYLHYFPIDTLKIDQGFIRAMVSHDASLVLVRSIAGLARNLGMRVIAEGIESAQEAKIVRDLGCEQCQGYWFAKPLPLEDALAFVAHWQPPAL